MMTNQKRHFDRTEISPLVRPDGTRRIYGRREGAWKACGLLMPQATNIMVTQPESLASKLLAARVGLC